MPKGTHLVFLTHWCGITTDQASSNRAAELDTVRSKTSLEHGLSKGYWDDDNVRQFKPERWLFEYKTPSGETVSKFSPKQGVSMPFGIGHRACFGTKLAVSHPSAPLLMTDMISLVPRSTS
jgi:hypothetical protein